MENEEMEMSGRHSLAHVMAKAIMKLYPKTKLTIGPAIEDGFYYDLDTADRLHSLELDYLANGGKLSDSFLKWAKENVPNIIQPEVYFFPLVDWLEERDIKFIERNNKE